MLKLNHLDPPPNILKLFSQISQTLSHNVYLTIELKENEFHFINVALQMRLLRPQMLR